MVYPPGPGWVQPAHRSRARAGRTVAGLTGVIGVILIAAVILANLPGTSSSGVHVEWAAGLSGSQAGNSVVAGNAVYAGDTDGNLYAFDATTGSKLWTRPTYYAIDGTPAVSDGTVYATSNGLLWAVSAKTGTVKWSTPAPGGDLSITAVAGTGTAGIIYLASTSGPVYAVSATTHKTVWSTKVGDLPAHFMDLPSLGVAPVVADGEVFVICDSGTLYALNASNGQVAWHYATSVQNTVAQPSPVVSGHTVYLVTGLQSSAKLYALSTVTGSLNWSYRVNYLDGFTPAADGGHVYISSSYGLGYVRSLDASNGHVHWTYTLPRQANGALALAAGHLYATDGQGAVYVIDSGSGCLAWSGSGVGFGVLSGEQLMVAGATAYIGTTAYKLTPTTPQPKSCVRSSAPGGS